MMNKKFAMSIMAHGNQEQHFSTFGCSFMQLIMTASPIRLPSGFSDSHAFYEFMVPLTEIPGFHIDGQEVKCLPGTLIPINPGQKHGVNRDQSKVSYILILFEQEIMDRMVRQISGNPFSCRFPSQPAALASDIQLLIMRMIQEKTGSDKGGEIIMQCMAEEMAVLLVRHYYPHNAQSETMVPDRLCGDQSRFQPAISHMLENFAGRISIDDLAELTRMNSFHFIRCFKRLFNISPYNYLTRVRISNAKRLLLQSDLPAAVIGKACGFQSASRFSAVFLKDTGLTPSQFRKENSLASKV